MRGRIAERLGWIPEYPLYATKVREEGLKRSDIIKLSSGETNFRAPDHVREAAKRAIDAGRTFYTSGLGIPSLRRAIARKIRADHGVDVDPETEVVITAGGIQAIFVAMMAVLNPGEEVLICGLRATRRDVLLRSRQVPGSDWTPYQSNNTQFAPQPYGVRC